MLPPNVFPFAHDGLTAKYAVLSEVDFARECGLAATSTSVWARFAQPSRLVWAADDAARDVVVEAVALAAPTLFALTRPTMAEGRNDPLAVFRAGFALTYGAELRAERAVRPNSIVDADPDYYRKIGAAALVDSPVSRETALAALRRWRGRQRKGKALTLLRLAKATTTFAGGIDYLAWKINRHAGTAIEVTPWQRRHPILAGIILLPRLLRGGTVR